MYLLSMFVVISYLCGFCQCQGGPPAGAPEPPQDDPYVLNFDSPIVLCDDDISQKFGDMSQIEAKRFNESTAILTGMVKFFAGLGEGTMVEVKVEKNNRGRLEMMFSHQICDLCDELQKDDSPYESYFQYFGFPAKCPFDAGEYQIHDLVADTSEMPINGANSGRYRVTLTLSKDADGSCNNPEFIACLSFEFVIELA